MSKALNIRGGSKKDELFDGAAAVNELLSKIGTDIIRMTDNFLPNKANAPKVDEDPINLYQFMYELYMVLTALPDIRDQKLLSFPLPDVVMYFFFSQFANKHSWNMIADFCHNHYQFFSDFGLYAVNNFENTPTYNGLAPFHQNVSSKPKNRLAHPHLDEIKKTDACGVEIKTPSADTFHRIFKWLDGDLLCKVLAKFLERKLNEVYDDLGIQKENLLEHYAADGKTDLGSARFPGTPLQEAAAHTVSLLNVSTGINYASKLTEFKEVTDKADNSNNIGNTDNTKVKKTNEIPIIQDLIQDLKNERGTLAGIAFTADAMSCQYKTIDLVADNGGIYTIQVKNNQQTLYDYCSSIYAQLDEDTDDLLKEDGATLDLISNKKENEDLIIDDLDASDLFEEDGLVKIQYQYLGSKEVIRKHYLCGIYDPPEHWENVTSCVCVVRNTANFATLKCEDSISYYIANTDNIDTAASLIRKHWGIEVMHFGMDTAFLIDRRRNRSHNCARNVGTVIKSILSIFQFSGMLMRNEQSPKPMTEVISNLNDSFEKYIRVVLSIFSRPFRQYIRSKL